jgi:hypothetical protein
MKKYVVVLMLILMVVVALPAHANTYGCAGTVTLVFINLNGTVVVGGPGGLPPVGICSVNAGSGGTFSPDACKAVYAMVLAAKLSGQSLQLGFNDNLTCSTQPAWGGPTSTSFWAIQTQ